MIILLFFAIFRAKSVFPVKRWNQRITIFSSCIPIEVTGPPPLYFLH